MTISPAAREHVLVLLPGALDSSPGGSAIRALELARQLRQHADVTLAAAGDAPSSFEGMTCVRYRPQDPSGLRQPLRAATTVISTPRWPRVMDALRRSHATLVFDLYDPEALELIPGFPGQQRTLRRLLSAFAIDRATDALRIGHRFMCASERQRDLWLGVMLAERLIDERRYDHDPSLRELIDVVPFGLPSEPPRAGQGARQRFSSISPDDEVVLWNGGLWPWLDAETPIRAVARLSERRPLRLVFMGSSDTVPARRAADAARTCAADLGVLDRNVFFNDAWVAYDQRGAWLLDANCAVSTHADHLETRMSFRTRLLDCIWAGLPIVCTGGDELGELVDREGLGASVPAGDADRLAAALESVLRRGRQDFVPAFERVRPAFAWPAVARPLVRWLGDEPPPPTRPRRRGPAEALRRSTYVACRRALDAVGVRDWPRL